MGLIRPFEALKGLLSAPEDVLRWDPGQCINPAYVRACRQARGCSVFQIGTAAHPHKLARFDI